MGNARNLARLIVDESGDVSESALGNVVSFASGTVMLFGQTTAPTGWTKDTVNHDNAALRVVTGSVGSGGSQDFTTAFASQTPAGTVSVAGLSVGSTTLTTAQMPSHTHTYAFGPANESNQTLPLGASTIRADFNGATSSAGSGGSHNHSLSGSATFTGSAINLAVKYVDVIRATKD